MQWGGGGLSGVRNWGVRAFESRFWFGDSECRAFASRFGGLGFRV